MNILINNQNEKINKLTGKINKIVSEFDSYPKKFQTVQKYVSEHETIKKEFNLLKYNNESFKKSQLIDPCSLAKLNPILPGLFWSFSAQGGVWYHPLQFLYLTFKQHETWYINRYE